MDSGITIMVVDDDEIDVEGVRRGFARHNITNPLLVACDGTEALALLRDTNPDIRVERPFLVLLDINMPRMSGLEFLAALRKEPRFRDTLIFMLTTSDAECDVVAAHAHNVAGYIVKSNVGAGFARLAKLLDEYCGLVEFPPAATRELSPA